jgi:hypothetical protein
MIPSDVFILAAMISDLPLDHFTRLNTEDQEAPIEAAWRIYNAGYRQEAAE